MGCGKRFDGTQRPRPQGHSEARPRCAMKAKRYFGVSICPRLGYCHSRRPPAPPNDIPQRNFRPHIHPQKNPPAPAKPHTAAMPSTTSICPRHTLAQGKHLPTENDLPAAAHLPTAANTPAAAQPPERPPSGQTPADARRFCRSAGRTGLENLRGGMAMHTPAFSKCDVQIT